MIQIILNELLLLKFYFAEQPKCETIISCPIIRTDNHAANITVRNLCMKLEDLKIVTMTLLMYFPFYRN